MYGSEPQTLGVQRVRNLDMGDDDVSIDEWCAEEDFNHETIDAAVKKTWKSLGGQ